MAYDDRVQKAPAYIEGINKGKLPIAGCFVHSHPPNSPFTSLLPCKTIKTRKNVQKGKENGKSISIYLVQNFRQISPQK